MYVCAPPPPFFFNYYLIIFHPNKKEKNEIKTNRNKNGTYFFVFSVTTYTQVT